MVSEVLFLRQDIVRPDAACKPPCRQQTSLSGCIGRQVLLPVPALLIDSSQQ